MKTYTIAMALLLLSISSFAQTQAKPDAVQTSFGRYGSDCSSGRGACSFAVSKMEIGMVSAKTSRKLTANTIVLEIKRSVIAVSEEIRIAGKPFADFTANEPTVFVQQEDLILSSETLKNLNIEPQYNTIKMGNYPMSITKDKVEVVFTLTASK